MAWRKYTQIPNKKFWEGPGWPDEISRRTRDEAEAAGWDAAGWAACRNASHSPYADAILDTQGLSSSPAPAWVVTEMLDRIPPDNGQGDRRTGQMVMALMHGVPPCVAWLIATDPRPSGREGFSGPPTFGDHPVEYWQAAEDLGLTGLEMAGWWQTGLFWIARESDWFGRPDVVIGKPINPWITALGSNAYLWVLAGYSRSDAEAAAKAGTVTEAALRVIIADKGIRLPQHENDHGAPEREQDVAWAAAMSEDDGWVIREEAKGVSVNYEWLVTDPGSKRVWVKEGWPPDIPEQTRAAAASAGWTDQDWVRLHTAADRHDLQDWLWNMPLLSQPVDPDVVLGLINAPRRTSHAVEIMDQVGKGVPLQLVRMAAQLVPSQTVMGELAPADQFERVLGMFRKLELGEQEIAGWLLTGYMNVPPHQWEHGDGVTLVSKKIKPWRDRFGPTAYLWVLAGVGLREAATMVKQPGWDETALRAMVALNGVVLPVGV